MDLITNESLKRPEIVRWHRRIVERYTPPDGISLTVILPCSAKKPYSRSKSHRKFAKYIKKGAKEKMPLVHEIVLTSPLGLVPRELEGVYPAAHYDVPVTGYWTQEEKEIALKLLRDYMRKADTSMIAHVDGAYREICETLDIPLTEENILSEDSLKDLKEKVSVVLEDCEPTRINRRIESLKKLCDFQLGKGSSEYLIPKETEIKGLQIFFGDEQIASINPRSGYISLTLRGGELLQGYGEYIVQISFRPKTNSIFSIGVSHADPQIRPGDEVVVVYNEEVVGVGRAILNGDEMKRAKKGLAIELRHRR
ncbi:MAG: DUF5591 domain-containing protein [Candidatus Hydrothermarchaeales archaeon]